METLKKVVELSKLRNRCLNNRSCGNFTVQYSTWLTLYIEIWNIYNFDQREEYKGIVSGQHVRRMA